jgi:threonyl-tRNA synthetase
VVVISISEKTAHYATKIFNQLKKKKIRADLDISNNTLGSKLKRNLILKTPFILIVGEEELKNNHITVREKNQNTRMTIKEFIDEKLKEVYTPISMR